MIETKKTTIYEILKKIQNDKLVIPAFQRQYVWRLEAVEKLWDSILLGYPISTFLFWKLDEKNISNDTDFCNFVTELTFNDSKNSITKNYSLRTVDFNYTNIAVLDGQQRLTSLYASLFGSVHKNMKYSKDGTHYICELILELDKDKIDNDNEFNTKKYGIFFTTKIAKLSPSQIKVKQILQQEFLDKATRHDRIMEIVRKIPFNSDSQREYAVSILHKLCSKIYDEELIVYTELTNISNDDAVEMFVRFNNGGKALKKSEINMSLLTTYWPEAKYKFNDILTHEFSNFDIDFLIKAMLMIFGDVARSCITRLSVEKLEQNWHKFEQALHNLYEIFKEFKIDINRYSNRWSVLLPILYSIYYNPNYCDNINDMKAYLMRAVIFTYFSAHANSKLQEMRKAIDEYNKEFKVAMLDQIYGLQVSSEKLENVFDHEKGSKVSRDVLYFLGLEWLTDENYEDCYLHPEKNFDFKSLPHIEQEIRKTWKIMANKLPNLHLNNPDRKDLIPLSTYLNELSYTDRCNFMKNALIPSFIPLELENFFNFYEERKKLMSNALKKLLMSD